MVRLHLDRAASAGARGVAAAALVACAGACTSFATVRSAEVRPGAALTVQASVASPPGDEAAWFWSADCAQNCNRTIPSADVVLAHGWSRRDARAFTLGAGVNGTHPYAEGYLQLGASARRPFGVGARVGLPVQRWTEHQLYGRLDLPLGTRTRLLWNPAVFYHTGNSPNGENPGTFVGLVQGLGLRLGAGSAAVTPSVAAVWGRAEHRSGDQRYGPASRLFGTAALSVTLQPRDRPGGP